MKVTSYAVARPAYYDRNGATSVLVYSATDVPHAVITRATFTTATGKKAYIEMAAIFLRQETAATVVGRSFSVVRITSGTDIMDMARIDSNSSTVVNTSRVDHGVGQPTIYPGETVILRTYDGSTGGSIDYSLYAKITTFDA
ncbi:MAG: hypothetical protein EBY17_28790 [Acidobacteriia bacterium]|nr:hypothetical protein [Terriglobia bacterium]